ncbi:hypothetical protein THAOC_14200 [Thalassiosira oceanica]|uniref:Uncharacterized protein n=1 Tax=Thalassiosira oceanica TaxID=159749 RepID=K0SJ56_THAOC|nr:hypothetical protein THAOC_14200 [Thalassiosira oceanica]|eukprot:EJK65004.1 hypothetical protein THAOC_14200 [Thalassiosira oceanica]
MFGGNLNPPRRHCRTVSPRPRTLVHGCATKQTHGLLQPVTIRRRNSREGEQALSRRRQPAAGSSTHAASAEAVKPRIKKNSTQAPSGRPDPQKHRGLDGRPTSRSSRPTSPRPPTLIGPLTSRDLWKV